MTISISKTYLYLFLPNTLFFKQISFKLILFQNTSYDKISQYTTEISTIYNQGCLSIQLKYPRYKNKVSSFAKDNRYRGVYINHLLYNNLLLSIVFTKFFRRTSFFSPKHPIKIR